MLRRIVSWGWRLVWGYLGLVGLAGYRDDSQIWKDSGVPDAVVNFFASPFGRMVLLTVALLIAAWRKDLQAIVDKVRAEDSLTELNIGNSSPLRPVSGPPKPQAAEADGEAQAVVAKDHMRPVDNAQSHQKASRPRSEMPPEIDKVNAAVRNLRALVGNFYLKEFHADESDGKDMARIEIEWTELREHLKPLISPERFATLPERASGSLRTFLDTLNYVSLLPKSPAPKHAFSPSLPKHASLYWDKNGRGSSLRMEVWNHAGYEQTVRVSCQAMDYWNGTQFARALDFEQMLYMLPIKPKGLGAPESLNLIQAEGDEFQVNSMLSAPTRHSAVGTWRLTLAVGSDAGQYPGIKVCFYWNPKKQDPLRYVACP